ncbi:MAG: response regulator transcription factor [Clostridiales bacterium]|nr:response regulator transcription factor [Roseburia sp.]MDD7635482.1 response regulator transcription factor [Clostridiales bacterium]MDY4112593.1 response regulator transcription factor [Roseburia sp.]
MEKNKIGDRVKILLIDEDESIFYLIRRVLAKENYRIYTSKSGRQGMEMSTSICPDLILMDTALSDMDGIELIRWFREWTDCPILVLSEQSGYVDKVNVLYTGADDYIVKPFHEQELAARVYAALRRRIPSGQGACYEAGDLKIDFSKRQVILSGEEVHFSPVEYRILECLALNAGAVVTYQMLLEKIWGPYASSSSRILRVNMTNIRKKIEKVPMEPNYIITIPRVGYRMQESRTASVS